MDFTLGSLLLASSYYYRLLSRSST